MKKLLAIGAAIASLAFVSCGGGSSHSAANPGFDSLFTKTQGDTMVYLYAQVSGWDNNQRFQQVLRRDSTLSKSEFVKGLRYAFNADTAVSFQYGMITGSNISDMLANWEKQGIVVNRSRFIDEFQRNFLADSVDEAKLNKAREIFNDMNRKYNEAMRLYERARMENSEESQANIKEGISYIDSVAKADPAVVVKASGLAYKIITPGEGPKVTDKDRVVLYYTASTPAGRVFDRADANNARPLSVSSRVLGLQEGLQELGKGGKAIIYVPGKLAYGVDQNRRYRLEPNQMIIYDVEVVDIVGDKK